MILEDIIIFLATQIFSNAPLLLGIIACIGLILLRKPAGDIITGTIRVILGYWILVVGALKLQDVITPLATWVGEAVGVTGVQPALWAVFGIGLSKYGTECGIALILGFIINLILARITRIKTVHITGHIMLIVTAFFVTAAAGYGFNTLQIIAIASIASGLYYWLEPYLSYIVMRGNDRLTDKWALGIGDGFGNLTTAWLSKKIGKREESTEDIKFPAGLEWLRDSQIAIAVFSTFVYLAFGLVAGQKAVEKFSGGTNWIIYLLLNGIYFSASLSILLYGVRIFIAEIVPAFNGISTKLIPGAIPGLDYPTMFQFAPTGMFIGYLVNLLGGILATLTMVAIRSPVIVLPSIFMNFWTGAMLGVFANAWGGRRATFIVPFLWGFIAPFGWAVLYSLSGSVLMEAHVVLDYTGSLFPWGIPYCLVLWFLRNVLGIHG